MIKLNGKPNKEIRGLLNPKKWSFPGTLCMTTYCRRHNMWLTLPTVNERISIKWSKLFAWLRNSSFPKRRRAWLTAARNTMFIAADLWPILYFGTKWYQIFVLEMLWWTGQGYCLISELFDNLIRTYVKKNFIHGISLMLLGPISITVCPRTMLWFGWLNFISAFSDLSRWWKQFNP